MSSLLSSKNILIQSETTLKNKIGDYMKIENVEYSLIPFGTATGDRAINVKVVDTKNGETSEEEAKAMISDLKAFCSQDKVLEEQLELAFIAKTQFYFEGDCLAEGKNSKTSSLFFDLISVESLSRQQNSVHVTKLRPPFLGYTGSPTMYSGSNNFYEQFNYLIISCGLKGINESNLSEYYRDFAMIEISRHQFCSFAFKIKDEADIKSFETFYRDRNVVDIDPRRIYFIPETTSVENINLVAKYCLKTGYRFGLNTSLYCEEYIRSI